MGLARGPGITAVIHKNLSARATKFLQDLGGRGLGVDGEDPKPLNP